ncbi:MAG: hypothetical protein Q8S84_05840 [bacterium]|nr:hypothetical protein [bacterium]MDP3381002.1 hypothetical protein [bacterium]
MFELAFSSKLLLSTNQILFDQLIISCCHIFEVNIIMELSNLDIFQLVNSTFAVSIIHSRDCFTL